MGLDRNGHLSSLRTEFPSTSTVTETSTELLLKVDHNLRISATTEYGLTLFIKIPPQFPSVAPEATMPYCFHSVAIAPPGSSAAAAWDPKTSTLVEAVRNAFQNAADRWGPVAPPTMASVSHQLSGETDRLLADLACNPNCLDAYCYQLPVVKQMREAEQDTLAEVRRVAEENNVLRPQVERLHAEVVRLQSQLQSQIDCLHRFGGNTLVQSVCTSEALLATLEKDVRQINKECDAVGRQCLDCYATDKRAFQAKLSDFVARSKQAHILDLKRRSFKQNALESSQ
ncbi:hypothetical protein STCU_00502 [Strigomonas culicis]|uniref:VPS37 C-terminal domain-containing protein n=1 Tax=Strigomonas culicis TaxID=28005 RepID=S9WC15_9TRYP|nr:hypothetical protein STCU_00502 [Strigomonas culicis]|eukprot:EPY36596.1 hypothetical protein STCU_00502 [Strigomonas culicis]